MSSAPPAPPVSAYFTLESETEEKKKKTFDPEVKFAKLKAGVQSSMKGARREYDRIHGRNGGARPAPVGNASPADNRNENANPNRASIPSPSLSRRSGGEDFETDENIHLMKAASRNNLNLNTSDGGGRRGRGKRTGCCANCCKRKSPMPRTIPIGKPLPGRKNPKFGSNKINNQKYNFITFLPICLFNQFKFFLNLFFLICAATQFIPELKVGLIWTYWAPLGFVLAITLIREAYDDFQRMLRDREINGALYCKHTATGIVIVKSANIKVGDIITIEKDQRVPADCVLLRTTEKAGSCFIRTDQLDGETDWKLRVAVPVTQNLPTDATLAEISAQIYAEKPQKDIYNFIGTYSRTDGIDQHESLSAENMIWSNTVVASGVAIGAVTYTGNDTRAVMNTSSPRSKYGKLDEEVNTLTKILFVAVCILSFVMVTLKGFDGPWYVYLTRYVLLFSYIIPISLRVNLDVAKLVYSWFIHNDKDIPGTVVRTSTLPEELGRIQYLLSDKTGTLTQNVMIFKRLHLGTVSYTSDTMDEIQSHLKNVFNTAEGGPAGGNVNINSNQQQQQQQQQQQPGEGRAPSLSMSNTETPAKRGTQGPKMRRTVVTRVLDAVKAIAICHNVTPVYEVDPNAKLKEDTDVDVPSGSKVTYQASSPDEVALVEWCEDIGLALIKRDRTSMQLRTPIGTSLHYQILQVFPFKSETKRMGIIVREVETGEITFYEKGADVVMMTIVQYNDWLEEETGNMAREGLRTLVVGKKVLSEEQYQDFENAYKQAKLATQDRNMRVAAVVESLERDLELLCLTGVEDKLQDQVRPTLELLRNAGIRIWMLTGDKMETATCIAKSSRLVSRTQEIHQFKPVGTRTETHNELNAFRRKNDCALVVQGETMETILKFYESEFMELTVLCPAVIICRCSPTQKAEVVRLLRTYAKKRTCAIGDGGNDVSMIQAADVGIGIVGKEGKQASLAADFSIDTFSYLGRLLIWHGRNSYRRSANLSQFIMHRGLLVSTMQAIFSSIFYFSAVPLFQSFLMVGYATIYTQLPVFSLVLDKDVTPKIAMDFPELYKELTKGRTLTFKTFFIWVIVSVFQGSVIMYGALLLFEKDLIHIVSITFTALLITEYLMIALIIENWHYLMIVAEFLSLAVYVASIAILDTYFDGNFLMSLPFIWKTLAITLLSCVPLVLLKLIRRRFAPPVFTKLQP